MQRSMSQTRAPPATEKRSPTRDPRIRGRTSSTCVVDHSADTFRGHQLDNRESLKRGDETPSTSTPQSANGRLENAPSVLSEPPNIQKAFSRHAKDAGDADFFGRKQKILKREVEAAQTDYEKAKRTRDKFPIIANQALQRKNNLEAEYATVKQEEANARVTEQSSAGRFIRLLLEEVGKKDDQPKALAEHVATLQKDLQDVRDQQTKAIARPQPLSDEVKRRLEELEDFRTQQLSENAVLKALNDTSKTLKRSMDDLRGDYLKAHETSRRQLDDLWSQQRASDMDATTAATQTIDTLKSEIEILRQRVETLEQKIPPIEAQIQDSQNSHAAEKDLKDLKEQILQVQESSKAQQQAADKIERLRKSIHLKVEDMRGKLQDEVSTVNSGLSSLRTQFSGLGQSVENLKTIKNDEALGIVALESRICSLDKVDQDQSERIAALDVSLEGLQAEFAKYTETRTASEEQRGQTLVDEIAKVQREVQREVANIKAALVVQREPQGLSAEERQQIANAINSVSNVRELGTRIAGIEQGLEKQSHMSISLNQRFNNLTTETLARQMAGVANKALPKFEKGLQKVEGEVQDLRQKMNSPIKAEGTTVEVEKRFQDMAESVSGVATKFQSMHDNLVMNFEEGRDKFVKNIKDLEAAVSWHETSQSTYRESTAKSLKALEIKLDNIIIEFEEYKRTRESASRKERQKILLDTQGPLVNGKGSQGTASQPKLGTHTVLAQTRNTPVRSVNDSDEEDDEYREAMLEKFKKAGAFTATYKFIIETITAKSA